MFKLIAHVQVTVIRGSGLPHFPDDFQPAVSETSQGLSMALAAIAQLSVIDLCPLTPAPAQIRPEVNSAAQVFVALAPQIHFVNLSRLVADRSGASIAAQAVGVGEERSVGSDLTQ